MTNEEARKILDSSLVWPKMVDEECEALGMAIKALEQTKWIPVTEKLPEDRREVLVTAYWHETYQVMMASYFGDGLWWCVPFNNCGEHMLRLNPIAWMPLPEQYLPDTNVGKIAESEGQKCR